MRSDKSLRIQRTVSREVDELRRLGVARRVASAPPRSLPRPDNGAAPGLAVAVLVRKEAK